MLSITSVFSQLRANLRQNRVQILSVLAFICLKLLFDENMGGDGWNEIDVLPLAKQFAEPSWIPGDWYLNQAAGYRVLFQALFGHLILACGFLLTSILGRLLCFSLCAWGIVLLGRRLNLSLPLLLLAIALFLYIGYSGDFDQGVIAGEWLVGGLEAKSVAYGLVLLAINLMLAGQVYWMALLLGLATSFHVLVGGWAFLAAVGWLLLNRKTHLKTGRQLGWMALIYLAGSMLALPSVLAQVLTPVAPSPVLPSYIYVFLRLPHHLDPLAWSTSHWLKPICFIGLLVLSILILRQHIPRSPSGITPELPSSYLAGVGLAQFAAITLVPFAIGVIVAPFDRQGQLLQYYPFRLGDIMLPFCTCLLIACALQTIWAGGKANRRLQQVAIALLSLTCCVQMVLFGQQVWALQQFPETRQEVSVELKDFYRWIHDHTPTDAIVVSPPVEMVTFSWLTERATIAKYKLFPQTKAGMLAWYERLSDLSGTHSPWLGVERTEDDRDEITEKLTDGYNSLTTRQVKALMTHYQASYFATRAEHKLRLPVAYQNTEYVLYAKPAAH
jgi:hypothetical protein